MIRLSRRGTRTSHIQLYSPVRLGPMTLFVRPCDALFPFSIATYFTCSILSLSVKILDSHKRIAHSQFQQNAPYTTAATQLARWRNPTNTTSSEEGLQLHRRRDCAPGRRKEEHKRRNQKVDHQRPDQAVCASPQYV